MDKPEIKDRFASLKAWGGPLFVLVMLIAALWFLHLELQEYSLQEFREGLMAIPSWRLLLAVLFTLVNYAILVCYDWLGIWYIRHPMKFGRVALASFLGYSIGNNFGLLFGGSTIRYRLYSTWGLSAAEIVKLLFVLAITFWIGLFALSGIVFLIDPLPIPKEFRLPIQTTRPLGVFLTTTAVLYLIACAVGKPLRFGKKQFHLPPFGLSVAQFLVASIDLLCAAAIVFVLMPASIEVSYFHFVGIFLLAQVAVFVTQVPGGLGVLEMSLLALLAPVAAAKPELFAAMLAYRLIFYLTPMAIGILMLGAHEVITQRDNLKKAFESFGVWTPDIAPRLAALLVFLCGICVLFAAAIPVDDERMAILNSIVPLWLIEINYFGAGVFGVLLLLLARGLYRRIRYAYWLTLPTLVMTIVFAIAGSLGYFQLVILLTAFFVVAPIRHYFHRRGRLLTDQIAWHWLISISVVLILSFWLFWFAYKKRDDLGFEIWRFALEADSPRSLRALLGAFIMAGGFYAVRLLQITIGRPEVTTRNELQMARAIVELSTESSARLALLGDKRLLFNEANTAMVAYSTRNKSCVAAGNPVGPIDDAVQIAWDFYEMCQQQAQWPVYFLVNDRFATLYQEMHLKLLHVADEALVDLARFDLESPANEPLRRSIATLADAGCSFHVIEANEVDSIIPDLQRIDATWQQERGGRQHRFSSSYFVPEMIVSSPAVILNQGDRIVAFASLWPSADSSELACGLVRYLPDAPSSALDGLLVQSMSWGNARRFRHFSFGPAPLAEWHSGKHQAVRAQLMSIAFRMSRHFYSYQGLRNYLERFSPMWQPLFLASQAERPLGTVLSDIAGIIGSGESTVPDSGKSL